MRIIAFILFCIFSVSGFSQTKVPLVVESAFDAMHPRADNTFWEHREGAYVVSFQAPRGLTKAFFNKEGKWLETRIRMTVTELPQAIMEFVDRFHPRAELSYAGKVLSPWGKVAYRIESELPSEVIIHLIDINGEVLEEQRIVFQALKPSTPRLFPPPNIKLVAQILDL